MWYTELCLIYSRQKYLILIPQVIIYSFLFIGETNDRRLRKEGTKEIQMVENSVGEIVMSLQLISVLKI